MVGSSHLFQPSVVARLNRIVCGFCRLLFSLGANRTCSLADYCALKVCSSEAPVFVWQLSPLPAFCGTTQSHRVRFCRLLFSLGTGRTCSFADYLSLKVWSSEAPILVGSSHLFQPSVVRLNRIVCVFFCRLPFSLGTNRTCSLADYFALKVWSSEAPVWLAALISSSLPW